MHPDGGSQPPQTSWSCILMTLLAEGIRRNISPSAPWTIYSCCLVYGKTVNMLPSLALRQT